MGRQRIQLLLAKLDYTFGEGGWFASLDRTLTGVTPAQAGGSATWTSLSPGRARP